MSPSPALSEEPTMSIKRVLVPQLPKPHRPVNLSEDEANHAIRVMRLRDGDTVEALDGKGHSTPAILRTQAGGARLEHAVAAAAREITAPAQGAVVPLILEMAVIKGDAMEWVVEKAVELGVRTLIPILTAHTVVQMKNKGPEAFQERWQKIADQALKQCGRLERLIIELPVELEVLLARSPTTAQAPRLWCDESARGEAKPLGEIIGKQDEVRLLIGPEGGWSENEKVLLSPVCEKVSLGPLVLRAETAALFGVSLIVASLRSKTQVSELDN